MSICFEIVLLPFTNLNFNQFVAGEDKNTSGIVNLYPNYSYSGKLRPWPQTPKRPVPATIRRPDYADHVEGRSLSEEKMRGNIVKCSLLCNINCIIFSQATRRSKSTRMKRSRRCAWLESWLANVSTKVLKRVVLESPPMRLIALCMKVNQILHHYHELLINFSNLVAAIERECYPSPLNYYKFPKSCCLSVNEVICHGIPDSRPLEDGDICNLDVTVYSREGFHGDLNETFFVGNVKDEHKNLVKVTHEALTKAIELVKPGERYREIGNVIQKHVQQHGYSVVKSYCGHGIHTLFHTAPNVPHYAKNSAVGVMKAGQTFTIEPMISMGTWRDISWDDNWTAATADGLFSAQFEQTLLVTDTGVEILTRRRENNGQPWFMDQWKN